MVTPLPLQLVKKVVQSGDTACLQSILAVFCHEDRQLLWVHCHARALAILRARPGGAEGGAHTREAIAYLSLAIFASGKSLPPPSSHPDPPASSHCFYLLMTYSPLFGKNVHLLCGLLYCYPLHLVVIEPPHFTWSHGNVALGLHFPVSLAICDHMTKLC